MFRYAKKHWRKKERALYEDTVNIYASTLWSYVSTPQAITFLSKKIRYFRVPVQSRKAIYLLGKMHQEQNNYAKGGNAIAPKLPSHKVLGT